MSEYKEEALKRVREKLGGNLNVEIVKGSVAEAVIDSLLDEIDLLREEMRKMAWKAAAGAERRARAKGPIRYR